MPDAPIIDRFSMSYTAWKFVHLLGVVLLVGNVTVTSVWKVFADRTREPRTIAFAQRLVTGTDWSFTGGGIVLMIGGGYGMALGAGLSLTGAPWLFWSQVMTLVSGLLWLGVLLPIQVKQARIIAALEGDQPLPERYRRLSRHWIFWGVLSTLPLAVAMWMMIAKVPR